MTTHSIPAVLVLALLTAAGWAIAGGAAGGAIAIAAVCLLHWPADVLTGCKPTVPNGPWIGLNQYRHLLVDLGAELPLLWVGWLAVRRSARAALQAPPAWWVPVIACAVQLAFLANLYAGSELFIGRREWTWHPNEGVLVFKRVPNTEKLSCRPPLRPRPLPD